MGDDIFLRATECGMTEYRTQQLQRAEVSGGVHGGPEQRSGRTGVAAAAERMTADLLFCLKTIT
jgi:hypothetical protein